MHTGDDALGGRIGRAQHWTVLLIGGHSGAGKSAIARQLARRLGVVLGEVDDFRLVLERMTTPPQLPELHCVPAPDRIWRQDPGDVCERWIAVSRVVSDALEIVIANHVATDAPIILEGDGVLPALAARTTFAGLDAGPRVRAVFVVETDERTLLRNARARGRGFRELTPVEQANWARFSRMYGDWLQREALHYGLPVVPAQPWADLAARIVAAAAA